MLNKDWLEGNYKLTEYIAYLWLLPNWKPRDDKTPDLTMPMLKIAFHQSFD